MTARREGVFRPLNCLGCKGELPIPARQGNPRRWCSERCRVRHVRKDWPRPPVPERHGICLECGKPFVQAAGRRRGRFRKFCSPAHAARAGARTREYRERAQSSPDHVTLRRREVGDRDGWRCHVCGGIIDPGLVYPHPQSHSFDHVVPLKRGGAHSVANVRSAHLRCNLRRGASGPAQIRMGL